MPSSRHQAPCALGVGDQPQAVRHRMGLAPPQAGMTASEVPQMLPQPPPRPRPGGAFGPSLSRAVPSPPPDRPAAARLRTAPWRPLNGHYDAVMALPHGGSHRPAAPGGRGGFLRYSAIRPAPSSAPAPSPPCPTPARADAPLAALLTTPTTRHQALAHTQSHPCNTAWPSEAFLLHRRSVDHRFPQQARDPCSGKPQSPSPQIRESSASLVPMSRPSTIQEDNTTSAAPPAIEADINAAAKIIGDISTGIYRSPANALKELVSNSFDAGATEVLINTDYPSFSTISCFDNGPGISAQQLQEILSYIGGSDKRTHQDTGPYGRPIVGKIGIGILAMSQIAKRFVIISSREGEDHRIEAEVDIEEFESEQAARSNLGTGTIGRYKIYQIPEESSEHYTIVATPAGSAMLRTHLGRGESIREHFVKHDYEAEDFRDFVKRISSERRRPTLGKYDMFLWELASLCPVPYFEEGPVRDWTGWDHIKNRLLDFDFSVVVDGYELRKTDPASYCSRTIRTERGLQGISIFS